MPLRSRAKPPPATEPLSWYGRRSREYVSRLCAEGRMHAATLGTLSPEALRKHVSRSLRDMSPSGGAFPLHAHQSEAVAALSEHIGDLSARPIGIVVIPTAGGKTEIFARSVDAIGTPTRSGRVTPRTLLVVPTLDLLDQTLLRLRDASPDLDVGVINGEEKRVATTTITTYASFMQMADSGEIVPEDLDCLVLDEAHRALSDLRQELLAPFLERVVAMAFTASPKFDEEKNIHNFLGAENEVFVATDERLRREKVIAPVINYVIRVDMTGERPSDPLEFRRMRDAAAARVFGEFLRTHADPETGERLSDRRIFGFARSVAHARHTAEYLNEHLDLPLPAAAVSSRDGRQHVTDTLAAFRTGGISVLMNKFLLSEGIDVPDAGGVVNLGPTKSFVVQLQRGGRCRRRNPALAPNDPAQIGIVVDFAYSLNGKMLDLGQVWYCQAIDDLSVARVVTTGPIPLSSLRADMDGFADDEPDDETFGFDAAHAPSGNAPAPEPRDGGTGPFTISHDLLSVIYLIDEMSRNGIAHLPFKTSDWLTRTEAATALGLSPHSATLLALWDDLTKAAETDMPASVDGIPVDVEMMRHGLWGLACLRREHLGVVGAFLGARPGAGEKTVEWLRLAEVALAFGVRAEQIRPHWAEMQRRIDAGGAAEIAGVALRAEWRRSGGTMPFCLHRDDLGKLGEALGIERVERPEDPSRWVSFNAGYSLLRCGPEHPGYVAAWRRVTEGTAGIVSRRLMMPGASKMQSCIAVEDLPALRALAGLPDAAGIPAKGDAWLTKLEAALRIHVAHSNPALVAFWQRETARLDAGHDAASDDAPRLAYRLPAKGRPVACVHESHLAKLAKLTGGVLGDIGDMTDDWVPFNNTRDLPIRCKKAKFKAAWDAMEEDLRAGRPTLHEGVPIRFELRRSFNRIVPALHRADWSLVEARFGLAVEIGPKTDDWLSMYDVERALNCRPGSEDKERLKDAFATLSADVGISSIATELGPVTAQWRTIAKTRAICVPRSSLEALASHLGLAHKLIPVPVQTEDWLTRLEARLQAGIWGQNAEFSEMWDELVAAHDGAGTAAGPAGPLRMEPRRSGRRTFLMLHVDDVPALKQAWEVWQATRAAKVAP